MVYEMCFINIQKNQLPKFQNFIIMYTNKQSSAFSNTKIQNNQTHVLHKQEQIV